MNNEQLERYSRHLMLPQLDYEGQQALLAAKVLIMGAGGLGSPVAMYLASSGVGHLTIVDFDQVEISNLQRQIIHTTADLSRAKVDSAKATLNALNPDVTVTSINEKLNPDTLTTLVNQVDVIVDTTDNFESRFLLNRISVQTQTPLVSGSVIRMEGQVTVFRPDKNNTPCYHCLYKEEGNELGETCTQNGVLAPVVGIIGAIQATETLKVIANLGHDLSGRLLLLDAFTMEWRTIKLPKDPQCPVCG